MAASLSTLRNCVQEAATLSRRALSVCLEEAVEAMQAAERASQNLIERDGLLLAWNGLFSQRETWANRFAAALETTSLEAARETGPTTSAESAPRAHFPVASSPEAGPWEDEGLSLMDDAQVLKDIAFARLTQQLRLQVDPVMADFDALMSAVQNFSSVRPERNPLRPEIYARVLYDLIASTQVGDTTRNLWLRYLAVPLGRELRQIYEGLVAMLLDAGIQAVGYVVVPAPPSGRVGGAEASRAPGQDGGPAGAKGAPASTGGFGGGGVDGGVPGAGGGGLVVDPLQAHVGQALYQDFILHGRVDEQARLSASYYAGIDAELHALQGEGMQAAGEAQDLASASGVRSPLDPRLWGDYAPSGARARVRTELRKQATRVGQVLGIEVVRRLVDEVAQDPRLLAPVREAIVALEPSLARLAMVDSRFFGDETHPGRRLMERVAQRSFKYREEASPGFSEFFDSVRASFNALNRQQIDSAQPFSTALAALENAWTQTDREEDARRSELLRSLRFAEERQDLANQIAYEMSSRPDLDKVPAVVLDFLFGPWALAMAHARLVDESSRVDPRGFGTLVSDLVWSVKRDFTLRQPAKLMDMIPGMLRKITAGMELIGLPESERRAFFDVLLRLHEPVLKLRRLKSGRDAQASGLAPLAADLQPATAEQRTPRAPAQPWLAPEEQDRAGLEEVPPAGEGISSGQAPLSEPLPQGRLAADPAPEGAQAAGAGEVDREAVERVLAGLRIGHWVDLYARRRWRRAQLVWSSTNGTLFMFVSHGGRPHSMTRRSLERLLTQALLRPVDASGVVTHALETLRQKARATEQPASGMPPKLPSRDKVSHAVAA